MSIKRLDIEIWKKVPFWAKLHLTKRDNQEVSWQLRIPLFKTAEGIFHHLPEGGFVLERVTTWSLLHLFIQIYLNKCFFAKSINKIPVPMGPF